MFCILCLSYVLMSCFHFAGFGGFGATTGLGAAPTLGG